MNIQLPDLASIKCHVVADLERKGIKLKQANMSTLYGALVASLRHHASVDNKPYEAYYDTPEYKRIYAAIMLKIANTYPTLAPYAKRQTLNKLENFKCV